MASKLNAGEQFAVNASLDSPNGMFHFSLQADGNLVLYGPTWEPLWSSGTWGKTVSKAVMQADGNFVLFSSDGKSIWSSGTNNPNSVLQVQDDGTVVISNPSNRPLWTIPDFINVKNLVTQLIQLKEAHPEKKIAFVFSGGGARAAWFGGALEAIECEVRSQQPTVPTNLRFGPDFLIGTSGGALAAVGYLADLINCREAKYGAYVSRQSWLWREISRGNEAASLLLDNPGVLELLSGSMNDKGEINWSTIKEKPLASFLTIANIPNPISPTYNFNKLIKSFNELGKDITLIQNKWKDFYATLVTLYSDASRIVNQIPANLEAPWIDVINSGKNRIDGIKGQAEDIKNGINYIRDNAAKKPLKAIDKADEIFKGSAGILVNITVGLTDVFTDLATVPVGYISKQFSDFKVLFIDIKKAFKTLNDLNQAFGNTIGDLGTVLGQLALAADDAISFIIATGKMINSNSSLMDTTGLKNALHEVLRQATPQTFQKNGAASALDKNIFDHWATQRAAKLINPKVRAPELILTASNMTANRLALLTLCDGSTAEKLAKSKRWVIGLNFASTGFLGGKKMVSSTPANSLDPKNSHHWIFGAWANDFKEPEKLVKVNVGLAVSDIELTGNVDKSNPVFSTTAMKNRAPSAQPVESPFEQNPGVSQITGTSVLAAAALTSATIPIAFPPRYWRFENTFLNKTYYHWFLDGGLCDNRPIEQALDAGADYIVSFELTPLRKAITDIPTSAAKPNLKGVISSITDTQINSAFCRFLETYVETNPDTEKKLWRLAPEVAAGQEDETIGVYDFNGYWHKGVLKMGLFDWFMRGYMDAEKRIPASPLLDSVKVAYKNMSGYGQVGNAEQKRASPGFYIVDFKSNKPHPGY